MSSVNGVICFDFPLIKVIVKRVHPEVSLPLLFQLAQRRLLTLFCFCNRFPPVSYTKQSFCGLCLINRQKLSVWCLQEDFFPFLSPEVSGIWSRKGQLGWKLKWKEVNTRQKEAQAQRTVCFCGLCCCGNYMSPHETWMIKVNVCQKRRVFWAKGKKGLKGVHKVFQRQWSLWNTK